MRGSLSFIMRETRVFSRRKKCAAAQVDPEGAEPSAGVGQARFALVSLHHPR
jgi:hypothetical protein